MICLISGKQGSGKTTLSEKLKKELIKDGFVVFTMKFADILYDMHNAVRGVMKQSDPENVLRYDYEKKDGDLLQLLGTEWGRKKNPDIWVKLVLNRAMAIERRFAEMKSHDFVIIIDDCRFPNELDVFKNFYPDTFTVRLRCPESLRKSRAEYWRENTNHPSETALDEYEENRKFDIILPTDAMTADVAFLVAESHIKTRILKRRAQS